MTALEFERWKIAYRFDPWGEERGDLRAGIVASAAVASNPYCKRVPPPGDFMPQFGPKAEKREQALKPRQNEEEMKSQFSAFKKAITRGKADGS